MAVDPQFQPVPKPEDFQVPTEPYDLPGVASELGEVIRDVPVIIKESKSGYKTTEFWASIVAVLLPLLAGAPEKLMVPLVAVISAAYAISRGIAKHGAPAEIVPVNPPVDTPSV